MILSYSMFHNGKDRVAEEYNVQSRKKEMRQTQDKDYESEWQEGIFPFLRDFDSADLLLQYFIEVLGGSNYRNCCGKNFHTVFT